MIDAEKESFDKRDHGIGIIFVDTHIPGQAIDRGPVREGDSLTLRKGDVTILVRSIKDLGEDRFEGIAFGFEGEGGASNPPYGYDERIAFQECHIIGCSRGTSPS